MATMYRSTDTGAPGWEPNANYNNAKVLMQIIKKCLVDGYGDKDPAGWTLVYEDTTANKYRFAVSNGNGVIEFVTWGTIYIGIFIWDEITTPGVGRLYDDPWATASSIGINGLSADGNPMPGIASNRVAAINAQLIHAANSNNIDWTIFADAKSCWLAMHYPDGHANAAPGSAVSFSTQHANIFFGAVKSADLTPTTPGNFFLLYGNSGLASGVPANNAYPNTVMGLRTPTGLQPGSMLAMRTYSAPAQFTSNPYSSVRAILPHVLTYDGADKPVSPGLPTANDEYAFATIPGIGKFSDPAGGAANFWANYTAINSDTWIHELQDFGGVQWMPYTLVANAGDGLTTDEAWWT